MARSTAAATTGRVYATSRAAILDAAREVLAEKSILQATVDDFVRAAGVARGTFYIYFTDRYDLLVQLYREITDDLYEQSSVEADPSLSTFDHIRIPILRIFQYFRENIGVLRSVEQLTPTHPELAELERSAKSASLDRLRASLEESIARGRARPIDARVATLAIDAMVSRLCLLWFGRDSMPYDAAEIEDVVTQLALFVYRGIFARDPRHD